MWIFYLINYIIDRPTQPLQYLKVAPLRTHQGVYELDNTSFMMHYERIKGLIPFRFSTDLKPDVIESVITL